MNIREIYGKYGESSEISVFDGVVIVESSLDAKAYLFVDKSRLSGTDSENQQLVSESVVKVKQHFKQACTAFSIEWGEAGWQAALKYHADKTSTFNVSDVPKGSSVIEIAVSGVSQKSFVLVRNPTGNMILFVSSDIDGSKEMSSLSRHIQKHHHNVQTVLVPRASVGLIKERSLAGAERAIEESDAEQALIDILSLAVQKGASDIHIVANEPSKSTDTESFYRIRVNKSLQGQHHMAYDDMLAILRRAWRTTGSPTTEEYSTKKSLFRTLEVPISIQGKTKYYQFRFQQSQLDGGVKAVMRVIDSDIQKIEDITYDGMGYFDSQIASLDQALFSMRGAIIFCGVTNSGKTFSISKMLLNLKNARPGWSIDSIEDPVEYKLKGVCQHPISVSNVDGRGMTEREKRAFAAVQKLNDLLRMDPDVINVGEIRDSTIASVFSDAVKTGHKAFSTLHTGNCLVTYSRLRSLGIDFETLADPEFINGIFWQSLVPVVCPHCALKVSSIDKVNKEKADAIRSLFPDINRIRVANPEGCKDCNAGVKGLTACLEVLVPDDTFNSYIAAGDIHGAGVYWRNEMVKSNSSFSFKGLTYRDTVLWKIQNGTICPVEAEQWLGMSFEEIAVLDEERAKNIIFADYTKNIRQVS